MTNTGILIVGGGLAGLALADLLSRAGEDFLLIEARPRLGGRIFSAALPAGGAARFDLGPAWFWPGQPRMAALVERFCLKAFEQHSAGNLLVQHANGLVDPPAAFSTMAGSLRINGGMMALVEALTRSLPPEFILTGHRADDIDLSTETVAVKGVRPDGAFSITARQVVLALPPRLAARLSFNPHLDPAAHAAMLATPTWMAGQAKVVATYSRPFWREQRLSGDAISRRGPLVEIHDASPTNRPEGALFGFVGIPAQHRRGQDDSLTRAAVAQLAALFGDEAARPSAVALMDWAQEPLTATAEDAVAPMGHSAYGGLASPAGWEDRLMLGSTEVASEFGGYLEGALEAAEETFRRLITDRRQLTSAHGVKP